MWDQAPLVRSPAREPQFWSIPPHLGPHRMLVTIPDNHPMVNNTKVRGDAQFLLDLCRALSAAGLVRFYADRLFARMNRTWAPLQNEAAALRWLQGRVIFCTVSTTAPPWEWNVWTRNGCETAWDYLWESAHGDEIRFIQRSPPDMISRWICQQGEIEGVRKACGILQHPYHVDPALPDPEWMPAYPIVHLQPGEEDYTHVKNLFSAFDLPPHSHVAAYTFLFAAFHVASLTEQRPILVIDSWNRGRGKTEVSAAIKYLIDKKQSVKSSSKGRDRVADESVASLQFARVEVNDNLDKEVDFMHHVAVTATTSVVELRPKYGAQALELAGKLFVMNCVVGACSFHRDILSRLLRVEIPGQSRRLDIVPITYAKQHRDSIIYEILHAHANCRKVPFSDSRFTSFFEAGLSAYCHVFGMSAAAAQRHLRTALDSGKIYRKRVLGSFMQQHPELLDEPHYPAGGITDDLLRTKNFRIELQDEDEGARAFGLVATKNGTGNVWK